MNKKSLAAVVAAAVVVAGLGASGLALQQRSSAANSSESTGARERGPSDGPTGPGEVSVPEPATPKPGESGGRSSGHLTSSGRGSGALTRRSGSGERNGGTARPSTPVYVKVPTLTGQTEAGAKRVLAQVGLKAETEPEYLTRPGGDGKVQHQSPMPHDSLPKGSSVLLHVGVFDSYKLRQVPNVMGKNEVDATNAIKAKGLEVSVFHTKASGLRTEGVTSVNPATNVWVIVGSRVEITVAVWDRGFVMPPPERKAEVPDVRGKTWSDAELILNSLGFVAEKAGAIFDPSRAGIVYSQDINAGIILPVGSHIRLVVFTN